MKEIMFADLFAGIGGFHFAATSVFSFAKPVLVCEIDEHAKRTYALNHNFPSEQIKNIRHFTRSGSQGFELLDKMPNFQLLMGGFPCQAFSNAGKKEGFKDDTRGTLFFDLATVLEKKKPRHVLLENVKALKTHDNGNTWRVIRDKLRSIGYLVPEQPLVLSPHKLNITRQMRYRVFIPAVLKSKKSHMEFPQNFAERIKPEQRMTELVFDESPPADIFLTDEKVLKAINGWAEFVEVVKRPPNRTLPVIWIDHLNSKKADTKGMSNWEKKYIRDMKEIYFSNKQWIDAWKKRHRVNLWSKREKKLEWQAGAQERDVRKAFLQLRQSGMRFKKMDYFPTLVAMVQTSLIYDENLKVWRYLSINEVRQLQSFPDSFRPGSPTHQTYKQFGNAVNVKVVSKILQELVKI